MTFLRTKKQMNKCMAEIYVHVYSGNRGSIAYQTTNISTVFTLQVIDGLGIFSLLYL